MEFNKLVRDKIPEIIRSDNKEPVTHIAEGQEYEGALVLKLQEEVDEFLENPSVEEIADILEVLEAVCVLKGVDLSNLAAVRQKKAEERGGFGKRIILERTEEK